MRPTLTRFRKGYEQITIPLGRICLRIGLTPDLLTLISLCLGAISAYAVSQSAFLVGVLLILLMTAADVLDGATARAGGTSNPAGMLFDHVVDRYAEFFILLGIMLSLAASPGWTIFALFGMVMASYVRARAEASGKVPSCDVGFVGRPEKLTILIIGLILQQFVPQIGLLQWAVIVVGVFSHITALQRLLYARRVILGDEGQPRFPKQHELV